MHQSNGGAGFGGTLLRGSTASLMASALRQAEKLVLVLLMVDVKGFGARHPGFYAFALEEGRRWLSKVRESHLALVRWTHVPY